FLSSRRRHTRFSRDWSSDVCSSDLGLSLLAFGALGTWAYFASIDEVVRGEGKVVPSQQVQIVQSLDGGIVEETLIRTGDQVEKEIGRASCRERGRESGGTVAPSKRQ